MSDLNCRALSRKILLAACFLAFRSPAHAVGPAPEAGACSLENAVPATVAAVDEDFELLLDDGRRAALSGLEFPSRPDLRAKARKRLSDWLTGLDVFLGGFAASPDRWGRVPARVFAASGSDAAAPIVSVGAALIEEGLARFRPDPPATPCAGAYRLAENTAREAGSGLWADDSMRPTAGEGGRALLQRKGLVVIEGKIASFGETRGALFLNFGQKRAEAVSIVVLRRNLAMLQGSGINPAELVGRKVRVRGLIETGFGPRIEISSPAEIEILDASAP